MDQNFVKELRASISIAEVIGEYVVLKKQGRRLSGLCPFHSERTPSFYVTEDKGSYFCFGCQKGGDVLNFLQEIQGIGFLEAVKLLCQKTGKPQPTWLKGRFSPSDKTSPGSGKTAAPPKEQDLFFKVNRFVLQFYHEQLMGPEGEKAREYLLQRGLAEDTWKNFYLGFAPSHWDSLHRFLEEKKAPLKIAQDLGLIRPKETEPSKFFDLFRNRVMFPIIDERGKVRGFGGRTLESEGNGPKYLNSPESPIFSKSQLFYGLFSALKYIREENLCIVVEGYMDWLALDQAGIKSVVATLGTAFTDEHAKFIKRQTLNVVILFDGDRAGQSARIRAMETFLKHGILVRGVVLPDGLDPDDYLKAHSVEELKKLIQSAPYVLDQKIADLMAKVGVSPDDQGKALDEVLPWISQLASPTAQLIRLQELSLRFGLDLAILERRVQEIQKKSKTSPATLSMANKTSLSVKTPARIGPKSVQKIEERFLEILVAHPEFILEEEFSLQWKEVILSLQNSDVRELAYLVENAIKSGKTVDVSLVDDVMSQSLHIALSRALSANDSFEGSLEECRKEWADILAALERRQLEKRRKQLKQEIQQAELLGELEKTVRLLKEYSELQRSSDDKRNTTKSIGPNSKGA